MWVFEYEDEIEADFIHFYGIYDIWTDERLDGPRYLRLAKQLVLYEGAVRRKMTIDHQDELGSGEVTYTSEDGDFAPGQTMSMGEALARSKGDDMAVLESLSKDSNNAGLGDLFEYETA